MDKNDVCTSFYTSKTSASDSNELCKDGTMKDSLKTILISDVFGVQYRLNPPISNEYNASYGTFVLDAVEFDSIGDNNYVCYNNNNYNISINLKGIKTSDACDPGSICYTYNIVSYLKKLCDNDDCDKNNAFIAGCGVPDPLYVTIVSVSDTPDAEYNIIYGLKTLGFETPNVDCFDSIMDAYDLNIIVYV